MAIKVKMDVLEKLQEESKGVSNLAAKIGIGRVALWAVRTGQSNPGENFVEGFLKAFPQYKFEDAFFLDES